jgi:hypothetical protein
LVISFPQDEATSLEQISSSDNRLQNGYIKSQRNLQAVKVNAEYGEHVLVFIAHKRLTGYMYYLLFCEKMQICYVDYDCARGDTR